MLNVMTLSIDFEYYSQLLLVRLSKFFDKQNSVDEPLVGVVLLHLLLLPGTAFLTGGARIWEQNLHPHTTQLNASLLTIG